MIALVVSVVMLKTFVFDEPIPDSGIITPTPDDDNLHEDDNNDNIYDEDDVVDEDSNVDKNIPSTQYPLKRLNYCLNKTAKLDSYLSELDFQTRTLVNAYGIPVDTKQFTKGQVGKLGNKRFENLSFTSSDEYAAHFAPQNNLAFIYYDENKTHVWRTPRDIYDMTKANYYTYDSPNEFYYDRLYFSKINFPSDGTICNFSSDNNVDTITLTITKPEICPETFMRSYYSFSGPLNFKEVKQVISFYFNSNTGYLIQFVQKDTFVSEYKDRPGIEIRQELTYKQTFTKLNQTIEINHPPIPETQS